MRAQPQSAYVIALRAQCEMPDAWYVEGVVVTDRLAYPLSHAWLETPEGVVIDPTPGFHSGELTVGYFGAHRWSAEEIAALMAANRGSVTTRVARYLLCDGMECLSYLHATVAVNRHLSAVRLKESGTISVRWWDRTG